MELWSNVDYYRKRWKNGKRRTSSERASLWISRTSGPATQAQFCFGLKENQQRTIFYGNHSLLGDFEVHRGRRTGNDFGRWTQCNCHYRAKDAFNDGWAQVKARLDEAASADGNHSTSDPVISVSKHSFISVSGLGVSSKFLWSLRRIVRISPQNLDQ